MIELLVVIAAIALFVTIAVTAFTNARRQQRDTQRLANIDQLSKALELYSNSNTQSYPTTCAAAAVSACSGSGGAGLADQLTTVGQLNDPSKVATLCDCDPTSSALCNYAFTTVTSSWYTVCFYLERALQSTGSQCNKLTPDGLSACT